MTHLITTQGLPKEEAEKILSRAFQFEESVKNGNIEQVLKNKVIACIFFEPSTRTRLSFETAALKLGAHIISAENASQNSSSFKGESIEDTTRMLCSYADVLVMRNQKEGSALAASKVSTKPIINAGDGANQHPSQGLLDLYTIKKECGKLEGLTIVFAGDLLFSRTLRSLVPLLSLYKNNKLIFSSPKELELPREYIQKLKEEGMEIEENNNLSEALGKADILYMTRVQKERFSDMADYDKVKDTFILTTDHLKHLNPKAIIMHPLPRINEIHSEVDNDPRAAYFRQAQNGLYVRMVLLCYALGL